MTILIIVFVYPPNLGGLITLSNEKVNREVILLFEILLTWTVLLDIRLQLIELLRLNILVHTVAVFVRIGTLFKFDHDVGKIMLKVKFGVIIVVLGVTEILILVCALTMVFYGNIWQLQFAFVINNDVDD